jgi:hypothetical protein
MKAITCDVILTGASTRADGSLSLRLATPELPAESKTAFFELLNQSLKILIQPHDGEPAELHDVKAEFDQKTPGQRLRATLFVLHKQLTLTKKIAIPFEAFYLDQMNRIIQSVKDQLEPAQF